MFLEKIVPPHVVKEFLAFFGFPKFITFFATADQFFLPLRHNNPFQALRSTSLRSILISFFHPRLHLKSALLLTEAPYLPLLSLYLPHTQPTSFVLIFHPVSFDREGGIESLKFFIMKNLLQSVFISYLLGKISLSGSCSFLSFRQKVYNPYKKQKVLFLWVK